MRRALAGATLIATGLLALHCWAGKNGTTHTGKKGSLNSFCVSVFQPDGSEDRWKLQTEEDLTPIPGPATKKSIELALQTLADKRQDPDLKLAAKSVSYHLEPRRPGNWGDSPGGTPNGYDCVGAKRMLDSNKNFLGCLAGSFDGCYICVARS